MVGRFPSHTYDFLLRTNVELSIKEWAIVSQEAIFALVGSYYIR